MQKERPPIKHREYIKIDKDYQATASAANLVYVSDKDAGIGRVVKGKKFLYFYNEKIISDQETLARIKTIAIPPAWKEVWIAKSPNAHIQATGIDAANRKQYRYHARWNALQQETKFHRMYEFGKALPALRKKMEKDLAQLGFPESKVMAMVVGLMERTYIRVGNNGYEKLYGSYGLTTLKNKHVAIKGDQVTFSFKGKKGIYHKISLRNKKFARIIKQCKSIPGRELFQYYDAEENLKKVDSGQVNQYIKDSTAQDFTTKDFRTWAGTLAMMRELRNCAPWESLAQSKKQINEALQRVSRKLGNTVSVCKKYYIHPALIDLFINQQLKKYFETSAAGKPAPLSEDEHILMKILKLVHREQERPTITKKLLKESLKKTARDRKKTLKAA